MAVLPGGAGRKMGGGDTGGRGAGASYIHSAVKIFYQMSTETDPPSPVVTEADLAGEFGVKKCAIGRARKELLTAGEDYGLIPNRGYIFTVSGIEKMRAAFPAPEGVGPEKNEARAPEALPERFTLVVVRPLQPGGRCCLCHVERDDGPPGRGWLTGTARKLMTLRPGMRLVDCTLAIPGNPEIYFYDGPFPQRLGQPMPGKKEGAV